jgi:hypothetical protein
MFTGLLIYSIISLLMSPKFSVVVYRLGFSCMAKISSQGFSKMQYIWKSAVGTSQQVTARHL